MTRKGVANCQLHVPGGHGLQSWRDPAYSLSRYVWNGQSRHRSVPAGAYVPCRQTRHSLDPPPPMVPFGHVEHAVDPADDENRPDPHATQVRLTSYLPASHGMHASAVCSPVKGRTVPAGHGLHALGELCPPTSRYVWNGQGVQALLPVVAYDPSEHEKQ